MANVKNIYAVNPPPLNVPRLKKEITDYLRTLEQRRQIVGFTEVQWYRSAVRSPINNSDRWGASFTVTDTNADDHHIHVIYDKQFSKPIVDPVADYDRAMKGV